MVTNAYLVSSVLTGVLLIGIAAYLVQSTDWRRYAATASRSSARHGEADLLVELGRSPVVWTVAFLGVAFTLGLGAVVFVGGVEVGVSPGVAGVLIAALSALVLGLFLFFGVYRSARYRGLKSAQAAGMGTWLVGLLLIVAVLTKLLVG